MEIDGPPPLWWNISIKAYLKASLTLVSARNAETFRSQTGFQVTRPKYSPTRIYHVYF